MGENGVEEVSITEGMEGREEAFRDQGLRVWRLEPVWD